MNPSLDLNLLRVLTAVAQYKTTNATATRLGISRSTVNRALSELRDHFGNEMFVVQDGHYFATPFTLELLRVIQPAISNIDLALHMTNQFDISEYIGELQLHAPASFADPLTARIHRQLLQDKSKIRLDVFNWQQDTLQKLTPNSMGIGINSFPQDIGKHLVQHKIGDARLMALFQHSHPLAQFAEIEMSALSEYPILETSSYAYQKTDLGEQLKKMVDYKLYDRLTVGSLTSAFYCIEQFNFIHIGSSILQHHLPDSITMIPLVNNGAALEVPYGLLYHRAWYQHPMIQYMERLLRQLHQEMFISPDPKH